MPQPSGTRSWIQRLVIRGRRRELGLGSVALVSLAEAREKALANRKLAREGVTRWPRSGALLAYPRSPKPLDVWSSRRGPGGEVGRRAATGC